MYPSKAAFGLLWGKLTLWQGPGGLGAFRKGSQPSFAGASSPAPRQAPSSRPALPTQNVAPVWDYLLHSPGQPWASLTIAAVYFPGLDGAWINLNKHRQGCWLVGWEGWAGGAGQRCIICGHLSLQASKPGSWFPESEFAAVSLERRQDMVGWLLADCIIKVYKCTPQSILKSPHSQACTAPRNAGGGAEAQRNQAR